MASIPYVFIHEKGTKCLLKHKKILIWAWRNLVIHIMFMENMIIL